MKLSRGDKKQGAICQVRQQSHCKSFVRAKTVDENHDDLDFILFEDEFEEPQVTLL